MIRQAVAQLIDSAKPSGTILTEDHEAMLTLAKYMESRHAATPIGTAGRYHLESIARAARSYIGATL